jgi:hypothetical protein
MLLFFHIITGILLIVVMGLRLFAVIAGNSRAKTLRTIAIITGLLQLVSGVGLIATGASVVHVCVSSLLAIAFIIAVEVGAYKISLKVSNGS